MVFGQNWLGDFGTATPTSLSQTFSSPFSESDFNRTYPLDPELQFNIPPLLPHNHRMPEVTCPKYRVFRWVGPSPTHE